jgi:hypothetical protein
MPGDRTMIAATGLRKSHGGKLVLGGIDLTLTEATTFAPLGPNGAGKTTGRAAYHWIRGALEQTTARLFDFPAEDLATAGRVLSIVTARANACSPGRATSREQPDGRDGRKRGGAPPRPWDPDESKRGQHGYPQRKEARSWS